MEIHTLVQNDKIKLKQFTVIGSKLNQRIDIQQKQHSIDFTPLNHISIRAS